MQVIPIPLFDDNYAYLVHGAKKENSFLVDPADEKVIHQWLQKNSEYTISHILVTHKHWDHAGGVPALVKQLAADYQKSGKNDKIEVVVGAPEEVAYGTKNVKETVSFDVNEIKVTNYWVPCHTRGHQLYFLENVNTKDKQNDPSDTETVNRCVFTGDTLFIGGSGRFFEGEPAEMQKNFDLIRKLPGDTFVFCGHEYTLDNFKWAAGIYPENQAVLDRYKWAQELRSNKKYTIPSTIQKEIETNLFMMTADEKLQKKFQVSSPIELMAKLRDWKNNKKTFDNEL